MESYRLYTLVDITQTNVSRGSVEDLKRDQQRNFQSLVQALSLRTQPLNISTPIRLADGYDCISLISGDSYEFGSMYEGTHTVWSVDFSIEFDNLFDDNRGNSVGLLLDDLNEVPIINGLEETARFILPCFFSYGAPKNIEVKKILKQVL